MVTDQQLQLIMDALGHQTRREILALLRDSPRTVGAIAEQLPISRPAVSKHLRQLEQAGLVEHVSRGTRNIFRLRQAGFELAREYVSSFWDEALERFRRAAESAGAEDHGL
ncbi:MAG: winged helix-turn-helix transcriptional regulator [Oscillochloris sp.]|nr:winged helix-turn-helix transcriptional regulator [Oscillochloris sp.]